MENKEINVETKNLVKEVLTAVYKTEAVDCWVSFRKLNISKICRDKGLDERYGRVIKNVMLETVIQGEAILMARGVKGATQYKISKQFVDFDALATKVVTKARIKDDVDIEMESRPGDLRPKSSNRRDPNQKYYTSSQQGKPFNTTNHLVKLNNKLCRIRSIKDRVYFLLNNEIKEGYIVGIRLVRTSNDFEHIDYEVSYGKFLDESTVITLPGMKLFNNLNDLCEELKKCVNKVTI